MVKILLSRNNKNKNKNKKNQYKNNKKLSLKLILLLLNMQKDLHACQIKQNLSKLFTLSGVFTDLSFNMTISFNG